MPSESEQANLSEPLVDSAAPRGVIYLSKIPRGFYPEALRHFFGRVGPVSEVFLTRRTIGGASGAGKGKTKGTSAASRGRQQGTAIFDEGWLEFHKKSHAKRAADLLNGRDVDYVSRKKKTTRADARPDQWQIRYLPGVLWSDVMDEMVTSRAVRRMDRHAELDVKREANEAYRRRFAEAEERRKRGPPSASGGGAGGGKGGKGKEKEAGDDGGAGQEEGHVDGDKAVGAGGAEAGAEAGIEGAAPRRLVARPKPSQPAAPIAAAAAGPAGASEKKASAGSAAAPEAGPGRKRPLRPRQASGSASPASVACAAGAADGVRASAALAFAPAEAAVGADRAGGGGGTERKGTAAQGRPKRGEREEGGAVAGPSPRRRRAE